MSVLIKKPNPLNIVGDLHQINFSLDDFKEVRKENYLYVDKTKWIEDLLTYDKRGALLFTRPRRFGKSLNLSMLRYFFDMTEDSKEIFRNLYIEKSDFFNTHLNQYPVLYLNFKDIEIDTIDKAKNGIVDCVKKAVQKLHKKHHFDELLEIEIESKLGGLNTLGVKDITSVLYENTGKRVIVLIDEYDSIVNQTYGTDYWEELIGTVKRMFGILLKSNEYLEMGVLTGVSRIGKELGFSDLNNLAVYGLMNEFYYEYFGFTEEEVNELLKCNNIEMTFEFYQMYNGYRLDNSPFMFNTVSILKFLSNYYKTGSIYLSPYWINASTNSILKTSIANQRLAFKNKLLSLLEGNTIIESIYESINYKHLDKPAYLLSLLIDTGYLCPIRKAGGDLFEIKIPNEEVKYGFRDMINLIVGADGDILGELCSSLIDNEIDQFEMRLNEVLLQVSSFHDFSNKENSYHNLVTGALLYMLGKYHVKSNRESGHGRYDIALIPTEEFKNAYIPIIIEFKTATESRTDKEYSDEELLELAKEALEQIERQEYFAEYADRYRKEDFLFVGIGTQGKRCKVSNF